MSTFKGFTTVELRKPKRSLFDLSHEKRVSTRLGRLTPIFISETLPNDTFRVNSEVMLRMAPMLAPIMQRINCFVHYFFVPNRLLWKDWEAFITGGRLGTETPPVPPHAKITVVQGRAGGYLDIKSLADYLGVGTIPDAAAGYTNTTIDIMPHAAFYKVWYDYYRDRNYVADDTILPLPSGETSLGGTIDILFKNRFRDWQKDYFTSALPWAQRGNQVLLPLAGSGSVTYYPTSMVKKSDGTSAATDKLLGTETGGSGTPPPSGAGLTVDQIAVGNPATGLYGRIENIDQVLLTTSSITINDFRRSLRLQEWMERNALAGSRYPESVWAHFNRRTSDGRLQRAEYLGGGKVTVKISEIVTTAWSQDGGSNDVPPADMAGHGISFGNTNRFTYNCEEHGFIIGIMSVMPTSGYMQGSSRMFFGRNTFLDYAWPVFAHLGEQEVKNYEIFQDAVSTPTTRSAQPTFGYQSRYAEYKYIPSSSHGDFKATLGIWHLVRSFATQPVLGATFCTYDDTLSNRIFAVTTGDHLWCYIYNKCTAIRSLPYYGTPSLI